MPAPVEVLRGDYDELKPKVRAFIDENIAICQPDNLWICDGSDEECKILMDEMMADGQLKRLSKYNNCYIVQTDPADVARVESKTVIVTKKKEEAVPTPKPGVNGELGIWMSYDDWERAFAERFPGCMRGRTMYVMPFSMGPIGGPLSKIGVQLTDSKYVVLCMRIMTRMGQDVLQILGDNNFIHCLHSIGCPLPTSRKIINNWPCNPEKVLVAHFPDKYEIKSFGSGYGGNSLLGKKCFALRIGCTIARDEGWFAEHMLISRIEMPNGKFKYIAAAFPSACGKTNLAMLTPTIPGYKVTCIGDDICWMRFDEKGQLRAINPEAGFFGVAPGTSYDSNPMAMKTIFQNTIFTNTATTSDGGVYWEGMEKPAEGVTVTDWRGQSWTPDCGRVAAHPNSRFTAPARQCPIIDQDWENPRGVPIDALIFGGRRPEGVPLVYESLSWNHGVFIGATTRSETTAAAQDAAVKVVRNDPFAMKPFFGYNFGQYLRHWLKFGQKPGLKLPRIYHVNWFRKDAKTGKFLWPGFGENSRVLDWICRRLDGEDCAVKSPVGMIPTMGAINVKGLPSIDMQQLLYVPRGFWLHEYEQIKTFFEDQLPHDLPLEIENEMNGLKTRLLNQIPPVMRGNWSLLKPKVRAFIEENIAVCQPDNVWICDGSEEESKIFMDEMMKEGQLKLLPKYKNCYIVQTDPADVARVESKTVIVTKKKEEAVPTPKPGVTGELGIWMSPEDWEKACAERYPGCMRGRTMYVMPFSMGPAGGSLSKIGVQLTDSKYVVLCMRIMTRMGQNVLDILADNDFVHCLHSIGCPLPTTRKIINNWPCNPEKVLVAHFPDKYEIKSFGSGYGGNSLLGKKCFALRIGCTIARDEGWFAEHMLISRIQMPNGKSKCIAAAFPSACGKTNLAMLTPTIPGYKVTCIGDDICWMRFDEKGQLRAINPEAGFFGVAPGTSYDSNPMAMATIFQNTIFTNTATTSDGGVWWEGMEKPAPGVTVTDWRGQPWTPECGRVAAHPNSRFTTPARQCPIIDQDWENPKGVVIDAVIFGGRRPEGVPLVYESLSWNHGVFIGATTRSETTAAAQDAAVKVVRNDPFAMKPFFGYNFGQYLRHWLKFGQKPGLKLPRIYHVNWFRKDAKTGKFLWPGFGENSRVLDWICRRIDGEDCAVKSPVGMIPAPNAINVNGLSAIDMEQLLSVPREFWLQEYEQIKKFFDEQLPTDLPPEIEAEMSALKTRILMTPGPVKVPPVLRGNFNSLKPKVRAFIEENIAVCQPDNVWICDGSDEECKIFMDEMMKEGQLKPLPKYKNCYIVQTDPADVARVESKTVIVTKKKEEAVPTPKPGVTGELGIWMSPEDWEKAFAERYPGCMKGRTMYVMPFSMGPVGGPLSKIGVQLTDSKYVVLCMRIMTRMGQNVLNVLGENNFIHCLHSIGCPLPTTRKIINNWPCNPEKVLVAHFPDKYEIKSFGSGYGGNSLLGKKCFALRIGSTIARDEGWFAEHMLISRIQMPNGKSKCIAAAFPSACGKTNLAMLTPTIPGYKVTCIGDDICWMRFDEKGQLRAINPEAGFFGVAPGTSNDSNPMAMATIFQNTIFTNTATTSDGGVWWEGMEKPASAVTITDWRGLSWTPDCGRPAAHPNSRFTTPARQCPIIDQDWENPRGVPIDAIIFGGRRPEGVPLVYESLSWNHGVFIGATTRSETTAAAQDAAVKVVRNDPFAMKPFFGYNFGQYLRHWLQFGQKTGLKLPRIYHVNWFRKDAKTGKFLWPGFGENSRVLDWICRRIDGENCAVKSPVGMIPTPNAINVTGLQAIDMDQLLSVPADYWLEEYNQVKKFFDDQMPNDLPPEISKEMEALKSRLSGSSARSLLSEWLEYYFPG